MVRSGRRVGGHIAERELLRSNVASNAACRGAVLVEQLSAQERFCQRMQFT